MTSVSYPNPYRNYCIFDENKVQNDVKNGVSALPKIETALKNSVSEDEVVEALYTLNCMLDNGVNKDSVRELYPTLSKYNNTDSANIQTFLAGIYRKTKIPDAFGPLLSMLIRNSLKHDTNLPFDPNEEIGGAILDYLA